jgi:hypothetical protein
VAERQSGAACGTKLKLKFSADSFSVANFRHFAKKYVFISPNLD